MIYVIYLLFFFLLLLYLLPPYLSVGIGIGIGIGITNIDITDTSIDITNINRSMLIDIGIDIGSSNIWYLYFTYLLPKYYLLFFTFFFCFLLYKLPGPRLPTVNQWNYFPDLCNGATLSKSIKLATTCMLVLDKGGVPFTRLWCVFEPIEKPIEKPNDACMFARK